MSKALLGSDVLFTQRLFSAAGLYGGELDGIWGPKTDKAAGEWDARYATIKTDYGALDFRSEKHIYGVLPLMQTHVRNLLRLALNQSGLDIRVISGTRTYKEQNEIYRQGRYGNKGPIVTNARGGQSNHNFGIAVDIGIFENGRYKDGSVKTDLNSYEVVGIIANSHTTLEWGGDWKRPDLPHYQLKTGLSINKLRQQFEEGSLYLVG